MSDSEAAARREARRNWPVRILRLGDEEPEDLSAITTAEERLAMVWELSARMWELTGRPIPTYERAKIPVTLVRRP